MQSNAQTTPTASVPSPTAPLSAIPWLSETLEYRPIRRREAPPAPVPESDNITVSAIDAPTPAATGLLSPAVTGLPADLWAGSEGAVLTRLVRAMPLLPQPALQQVFDGLLLLEATPPAADGSDLLLARIDALLLRGALDPAQALLERAGPDTPALFRRWFDISLLNGTEDRACATLAKKPELSPNYETRIFCLARMGRWLTAALTLETATALDRITPDSRDRLARFLDPELFEGDGPAPRPSPVTPLDFRILEAVGEPVPTSGLPLAFAQSDLRHVIGWKAQLDAAERLARVGSLPVNTLLGIYTARRPAASGGVWDRVTLLQELDIEIAAGDATAAAMTLPFAWNAMREADLEAVFAQMMAPRLSRLSFQGEAARMVYELGLISNSAAALAPPPSGVELSPDLAFAAALATGDLKRATPVDDWQSTIRAALLSPDLPPTYARMIEDGRTGEALLTALARLVNGREGDPMDIAEALQLLRALGQEATARQAALQILRIEPRQ
ncbi:hypothetical protein BV911_07355 [Pseudoruegeria sp. SK021]|nr:hypothetical protein BV911_07355 [Pseudoruegeria sp. SK021]